MRKKLIGCVGLLIALLIIVPLPPITAQAAEEVFENEAIVSFSNGSESKTYTVARTGSYRLYVYGKGGSGGSAKYAYADTGTDSFGPSGSGGGSGGVVIHDVDLTAGTTVHIDYDGDTVTVTGIGSTLIATAGKDGSAADYHQDSGTVYCTAASGGIGGSGSGGNVSNIQGATGGAGTGYNPNTRNNGSTGYNDKKYGGAGGYTSTKYGGGGKSGAGGAGGDCVVVTPSAGQMGSEIGNGKSGYAPAVYFDIAQDTTPPVISSVTVSSTGGTTAQITINATDNAAVTGYAVTTSSSAPATGWQTGNGFTLTSNGNYYAWARDDFGNVGSKGFTVSTIIPAAESVPEPMGLESSFVMAASASTANTLDNYALGTVFKIKENGTYQNWILVSHDYLTSGNQLLMREDTVYYATAMKLMSYDWYNHSSSQQSTFSLPVFKDSTIATYLNGTYKAKFDSALQACLVSVNIPTLAQGSVKQTGSYYDIYNYSTTTYNCKLFILSPMEISGLAYDGPSDGYISLSTGTYIDYFQSNTQRAADNDYALRDMPGYYYRGQAAGVAAAGGGLAYGWGSSTNPTLYNGRTYFRPCIVLSPTTIIGSGNTIDGIITPTISSATASTSWGTTNVVTVTAADAVSYALTTTNTAPSTGWQTGNTFTVSNNGTYYAWAKSSTDTVSASKSVTVSKVDNTGPSISGVSVSSAWALSNTAVISASDTASGVSAYSTNTNSSAPPSGGWQSGNTVEITANGTYFAWTRDAVGNVSAPYEFTISKVDNTAPIITSVNVPSDWAQTNTVTLNALDIGSGISSYAVTTESSAPPSEGWEGSKNFDITDNGTYFAWTRDSVGNVSVAYEFSVTKVDTTIPVVNSVSVPDDWATSSTVTVSASDAGSGVATYAVTTGGESAPVDGWQADASFTLSSNGTYFAWARDAVGNVSAAYEFTVTKVDTTAPVIGSVTVPDDWATSSTVTVSASDAGSGVATYAVTTEGESAPVDGWQADASFTLSSNGTYYAWARDAVGNISDAYELTVTKVDTTAPVIGSVTVPGAWATSSTATITAADTGSGVADYAVTTDGSAPPSEGWQSGQSMVIPANGTYFAWARDAVGNISDAYEFTVTKVDTTAPVIGSVTVPEDWATSSTVTVSASDVGSGVATYAVSTTGSAPPSEGWQTDSDIQITANGTYYAWTRDAVGNVSDAYEFTVTKVDTTPPVISSVTVPGAWATSSSATISASDVGSGLSAYAVTADDSAPSPAQWQAGDVIDIAANGTYFAWARDAVGNVSDAYQFTVTKVDTTAPMIESVTVPGDWGLSSTISVDASDTGSGVAAYAVTTGGTLEPVAGWQSDASFTFSANGTYFAWVKDEAGNVSVAYEFTITKVDTVAPVINAAVVPDEWATSSTVTITAADTGSGVAGYAVTTDSGSPPASGWQIENVVDIADNGTYYAWTRDNVGNISAGYAFTVTKIDTAAPEIISVDVPDEWGTSSAVAVSASDIGSGIAAYAISTNGSAPPDEGWQDVSAFTVEENGSQFAFVKDFVGNVSVQSFAVTKVDIMPPTIEEIEFSDDHSLLSVTASDDLSGVDTIFVNMTEYAGSSAAYPVAEGTRYATIFAVDLASNQSGVIVRRVPGWFDVLDTITIDSVETLDEETVKITASSTIDPIVGIWINGEFFTDNPLTYKVPQDIKTLEIQAQDVNGDRSEIYTHLITGREEEIPSLTVMAVDFSANYLRARITATEIGTETSLKGIKGIQVNNDFLEGNPVDYDIPEGTKKIAARAINNEGDYSKEVVKRVPGWSEIVGSLQIDTVTFNAANTEATITAISEGAAVSGIYVNDVLSSGNPVVYSIPSGTTELVLQAENTEGDRSETVTVAVPHNSGGGGGDSDADYSYRSLPHITILPPAWTNAQSATIEIQATDEYGIREIYAQTSDQPVWREITQDGKITISQDTTVFAYAVNSDGAKSETHLDIACFDRQPPTVTATQQGDILNVRARDEKSGVSAIVVDGTAHSGSEIYSGSYSYSIPIGATTVTVMAVDNAGNESETVKIAIQSPAVVVPGIVEEKPSEPMPLAPTPAPQTEPPSSVEVEIQPIEPAVETQAEHEGAAGFIKILALLPALLLLVVLILLWKRKHDKNADAADTGESEPEKLAAPVSQDESAAEDQAADENPETEAAAADNHVVVNFGNSIVGSKFRKLGGK